MFSPPSAELKKPSVKILSLLPTVCVWVCVGVCVYVCVWQEREWKWWGERSRPDKDLFTPMPQGKTCNDFPFSLSLSFFFFFFFPQNTTEQRDPWRSYTIEKDQSKWALSCSFSSSGLTLPPAAAAAGGRGGRGAGGGGGGRGAGGGGGGGLINGDTGRSSVTGRKWGSDTGWHRKDLISCDLIAIVCSEGGLILSPPAFRQDCVLSIKQQLSLNKEKQQTQRWTADKLLVGSSGVPEWSLLLLFFLFFICKTSRTSLMVLSSVHHELWRENILMFYLVEEVKKNNFTFTLLHVQGRHSKWKCKCSDHYVECPTKSYTIYYVTG